MIEFKGKGVITAVDVPLKTIIWEYICWTLAGKPDNYKIIKKSEKKA